MSKVRFSKKATLAALDKRAADIAQRFGIDRSNGIAQLSEDRGDETQKLIDRAVAYGKMRAYEQFAETIEEGLDL